jgi:hypothetical protein
MHKRKLSILLSLMLFSACAGKQGVSTQPKPTTDPLAILETQSKTVTALINTAIKVKRALREEDKIDAQQELDATLKLQAVNTIALKFIVRLKAINTLTATDRDSLLNILTEASGFASDLNKSGVFGIKNPDALSKVNASFAAVDAALLVLKNTLGGLQL